MNGSSSSNGILKVAIWVSFSFFQHNLLPRGRYVVLTRNSKGKNDIKSSIIYSQNQQENQVKLCDIITSYIMVNVGAKWKQ